MNTASRPGMLAPYRVLDLTDGRAELASFILAGLGADVIKVEPPGGSPSRETDLRFQAQNRGKSSVVLDLDQPDDRGRFGELVASADFVIENAGPGAMDARGLGFDALTEHRPDLVYVAVSPFGQTGPYADHLATDLTLAAMGGMMALTGDPDRRPVRVSVPQAWLHASGEAAVASLVAHHQRLATGEAQFVDLSVQAAVFWTGLNAMIKYAIDGSDAMRCGTELSLTTLQAPLVYPAADGDVCTMPTRATLINLLPWMHETGVVTQEWLDAEDWETYDRRHLDGDPLVHSFEEVLDKVRAFTVTKSKAELFEGGLHRGMTIVPVSTTGDTLAMEQLDVREYWDEGQLPSGHPVRFPGAFAKVPAQPVQWARPAPGVGEHTDAVLAALTEVEQRAAEKAQPKRALPLEGIKVADFSWIGVGPITGKALADHGATVVRIEAEDPPDRLRLAGPFTDGVLGINRCQFYGSFNTSKLSLQLNLKHPTGQDVARRMLEWCDISLNSFVAGTMNKLGLGYDVARELNPQIIMAETCLFGQTGPISKLAGYGYHAAAVSGFYEVTGWADRAPGGPWNAYTDTVAPRFLIPTILAALDHRRRTGEGQYIEMAQAEAALHFLGPELLETQMSGSDARRQGNEDPAYSPHDVYPCAGDDEWCAIAIGSDEQWRNLCGVLGDPAWSQDAALNTLAGRQANVTLIDEHLAAFTSGHEPRALTELLQAAGVPAGMVQRSSDNLEDPQLAHRNFFRPMEHPEMGEVPYEGHQYTISGYDNGPRSPAPCLGQHTFEVLTDLLGLDAEEAVEILASGACG